MKDISEISKSFDKYIERLSENIIKEQNHATEYMLKEAKDNIEIPEEARNTYQFIKYRDSIKQKDVEIDKDEYKSEVNSELTVYWEKIGDLVPVGAFLEWGTGPLGEGSNTYPHGYDYTTEMPWDYHTWLQNLQYGTWGITARPHMYPAFVSTQPIFINNIKEAIEESWTQ